MRVPTHHQVNTASRMESNSEANRIHLSSEAANQMLLHNEGSHRRGCHVIRLVSRGPLSIKGKGVMDTFWLEWEDNIRKSCNISMSKNDLNNMR